MFLRKSFFQIKKLAIQLSRADQVLQTKQISSTQEYLIQFLQQNCYLEQLQVKVCQR